MIPAHKNIEKLAETAAVYLGRSPTEKGVDRLAADLSVTYTTIEQHANACVEAFRPLAEMGRKPRPCIECGDMTTGSVGAAGIRWPALCQPCKDQADGDLSSRIRAAGSIGNTLYMGLMERSRLEIIERETRHESDPNAAHKAEFLASMDRNAKGEC